MSRQLATVREIKELLPIPKADRIELALVDGWQCVVKKGEFKQGDLCIFFEIDSVLPEKDWSEFMRPRKFRVKTARFMGQLAQGLALPLSILNTDRKINLGEDVSKWLGVTKYLSPAELQEKYGGKNKKKKIKHAWMLRFSLTRKLHQVLWPRKNGGWPEWEIWV